MKSSSTATTIIYRRMTEADLDHALGLSQAVGWPHRREDWQLVHRLGSGFVAEQDRTIIGTGMCWKQGDKYGSLGMMIVSPEHQGKGIGRKLITLVLEELGDRCVLLSATPAGQPLYESLGFSPASSIHQHQGVMAEVPAASIGNAEIIRPLTHDDMSMLIKLANRATGMERGHALKQLTCEAQGVVLDRDGEIGGFSFIRPFGLGYVIGPVVAKDSERAKALISYWSRAYADSFVRVDVTADGNLGDNLSVMGLAPVDTVVAMVRNGPQPRGEPIKQFAIFSQALC
ncbi:GCN5 family acetyltransferase (plasmid) [Burkholderia sp. KK1]|nr:GCN5 family acetyltransferase [Burkholderia sp. KK1]